MSAHRLDDPSRLEALHRLQILDTGAEEAFDRLGRLAQRLLGAPVALVSLVDADRQFLKSALGIDGPVAVARQTPLSHSFCQHVASSGEALVVNDAPHHPLVRDNLAIRELGVQSYLGFPVRNPEGFVLGSFCAIDHQPRQWTQADIETMRELTELVVSQVALIDAVRTDALRQRQIAEERRRVDQKLAEAAKLESLGILAGGIAHEFNNLLTAILGNASLLRISLPAESPSLLSVEQVERASRRAAELCRQMLAYSGRGRFVVGATGLNEIVKETGRMIEISVSKHCVLRFHLAPSLPPIDADTSQISQILLNLSINASEAIGERSGVIAISTGVVRVDADYAATFTHGRSVTSGDYVFLEVSDTGCGMDAATIGRAFDPFFSTKFTGRGLGLSAVLGICRAHRGAIKVYSEPGKGTSLRFFFPALTAPRPPGPASAIAPAPTAPTAWTGNGTVLVADDEETVRATAAQILELMGFKVQLASDGRQAVELFQADPTRYSLVLLDLTMPQMDGEAAFRQLRHIHPGVRVLVMSGFSRSEVISRFFGKGLAGFIQKPFEVGALMEAVKAAFAV